MDGRDADYQEYEYLINDILVSCVGNYPQISQISAD